MVVAVVVGTDVDDWGTTGEVDTKKTIVVLQGLEKGTLLDVVFFKYLKENGK